jgi:lysozyme
MLDASYLDAIKQFEGYSADARWDYAQNTNGYGTRARFAGEVIDKAEADKRFQDAIKKASDFVDNFAPGLDAGSKAALTSLTYNAGTAWAQSGLGDAVARGDMDTARSLFLQYNKAGGSVVDGLVQRRLQEVAWFGGNASAAGTSDANSGQIASATTDFLPMSAPETVSPRLADMLMVSGSDAERGLGVPRAFSGLGSDPALLSLLARLGKSRLSNDTDSDTAERKAVAETLKT